MQKYSIFSLIKNAFSDHQNWDLAWKDPQPKKEYEVIIIGGGGHGLATAYYLAKEHNITNVAVIEKGWIGGGNVGRNTTILRSNYMFDANAHFYELGMKLWENLSQELNYNVMSYPILKVEKTPNNKFIFKSDSVILTTSFYSIYYLSRLTFERNFLLYTLGEASKNLARKLGFKNIIECNGDSVRMFKVFINNRMA